MCALPASIHPPEKLIHMHTHTQLHGPSAIRLLQDTYLGHGQEAGRSWAHELPSSLHPLRNLPSCCSSASKPLSPRSPGAVGAGVKATCPAEGPRATGRVSHSHLLPCGHDCPSRGIWHPRGPCTKHCVRAPPLSLAANHPEQLTFRISVYFISTQNASISPLRK